MTAGGDVIPYLRAQQRVWTSRLVLAPVAAAAAVVSLVSAAQVSTGQGDISAALGALNVWVVAAAPLLTALLASLVARVHRAARDGGLSWRGVAPATTVLGRVVVMVTGSVLLQISALTVWCLITMATVRATPAIDVVGHAAEIATVLALTGAAYAAVLAPAASLAPVLGPIAIAPIWIGSSIVAAESSWWQWVPSTWQVRSAMSLIGTHVNGTALDGASLPAGPVPIVGSSLIVLLVAGRCRVAPNRSRRRGVHVVAVLLRGWAIPCAVVVAVMAVATTLRWRPPSDAAEVFALVVLPLGCWALAVWVTGRVRAGVSAVVPRLRSSWRLGLGVVAGMDAVVMIVVLAVTVVLVLAGAPVGPVVLAGLVWGVVGVMLVSGLAAVAVTVGSTAASAMGLTGTVIGALVGGTSLDAHLGVVVPWAWAWAVHPGGPTAATTTLSAAVLALAGSAVAARRMFPVAR
jgi:hypothetical protein